MSTSVKRRIKSSQVKECDPARDQIILLGSSIEKGKLPTLSEWLRAGSPVDEYGGPTPLYKLKFDWREIEDAGHVGVVNKAMERCFGSRGTQHWQLWIRGDQLSLLLGDFREEYVRLEELNHAELGILDAWMEDLADELKRV